jgi:hypothetical protein
MSKLNTKSSTKRDPCGSRVAAHMFDVSAYLIKREQKIRVKYYEDSIIQNLHGRL